MVARPDRRGFTLFELMLALALVGGAMLGAVLLLDALNDDAGRIASEGARTTREGNAERELRRLVLDARPDDDTTRRFLGDARSVSMHTRCAVPAGWSEPCDVTLAVDDRGDTTAVDAELSRGGSLVLLRDTARREWRYLDPAPRDTVWATHWSSATTLPVALALVSASDTIVLPIQVRRD